MSLSALLLSSTFLLMPTLLTASNEILDDHDPLFLGSDESVAASLVLLSHLCQILLMGIECLAQLLQRLRAGKLCELFQLGVTQAFRVEDEPDIWRLWRWYPLQRSPTRFCPCPIPFDHTFFERRHGHLRGYG